MSEDMKYHFHNLLEGIENETKIITGKDAKEHDKELCRTIQECMNCHATLEYKNNGLNDDKNGYVICRGVKMTISIYSEGYDHSGSKIHYYYSADVKGLKKLLRCNKS